MGTNVCVFGCCVTSDFLKYTFPDRYEICVRLGRNPVSTLQGDAIQLPESMFSFSTSGFNQRMIAKQFQNDCVEQLLNAQADYLILDFSEERLPQYVLSYEGKHYHIMDFWINQEGNWFPQVKEALVGSNGLLPNALISAIPARTVPMETIRETYHSFVQAILKSDSNPNGYAPEQIIVIESYLAKGILNPHGKLQKFHPKWHVEETNAFLKPIYELFYQLVPTCHIIRFPDFTFGNWYHIWNSHPLHYTDAVYRYIATALDIITGHNKYLSTPEKLWKQQSLENQLAQRVANATPLYDVAPMKRRLEQAEAQIHTLNEVIQKQQETIDALQVQINQWNAFQSDKE